LLARLSPFATPPKTMIPAINQTATKLSKTQTLIFPNCEKLFGLGLVSPIKTFKK